MSFLDKVEMAFTCPLKWEKLTGEGATRHCGKCDKHVHNLSEMSRPQAKRFLDENKGLPVCIRVEVDAMGKAVHRPQLQPRMLSAGFVAAAMVAMPDQGCLSKDTGCERPIDRVLEIVPDGPVMLMGEPMMIEEVQETHELMGDIAYPVETQELIEHETPPQNPESMQQRTRELIEVDPSTGGDTRRLMGRPAITPERQVKMGKVKLPVGD